MAGEPRAVIASALRTAIRNWLRLFPKEIAEVAESKKRFEGTAERLFDHFLKLSIEDHNNRCGDLSFSSLSASTP